MKGTFEGPEKGSITDGDLVIDVDIENNGSLLPCAIAEGTFVTVQGLLVFKGTRCSYYKCKEINT